MTDRPYILLAFRIFAEFGVTIALPAVLAALIGTRLDRASGGGWKWVALCLLLAFTLTAIWLVRRAKAYKKLLDRLDHRPV